MQGGRWPLFGMIAAASLAAGSCAGIAIGHFTVTGGVYPNTGWDVPRFGAEEAATHLPAPVATARVAEAPHFVGYYPAVASDVPAPHAADAAAREFDALFDRPSDADLSYARMDAEAAAAAASAPRADRWASEPVYSADPDAEAGDD